jgi:hypothetical protein
MVTAADEFRPPAAGDLAQERPWMCRHDLEHIGIRIPKRTTVSSSPAVAPATRPRTRVGAPATLQYRPTATPMPRGGLLANPGARALGIAVPVDVGQGDPAGGPLHRPLICRPTRGP